MARKLLLLLALALVSLAAASSASAGGLIAPASTCPNQWQLGASASSQEQTMLCLTNYARVHDGENALVEDPAMIESAADKGHDVFRCDEFSHYACGREFTYWFNQTDYLSSPCWRVGENLAWGVENYGTPGSIFRAWMHSPDHRANLLGNYETIGIVLQSGELEGHEAAHLWTQHFGSHCGE